MRTPREHECLARVVLLEKQLGAAHHRVDELEPILVAKWREPVVVHVARQQVPAVDGHQLLKRRHRLVDLTRRLSLPARRQQLLELVYVGADGLSDDAAPPSAVLDVGTRPVRALLAA